jgi:hypothetical protein
VTAAQVSASPSCSIRTMLAASPMAISSKVRFSIILVIVGRPSCARAMMQCSIGRMDDARKPAGGQARPGAGSPAKVHDTRPLQRVGGLLA